MEGDIHRSDVVGLRQVLRALDADELEMAYLADDAEEHIRKQVLEQCAVRGVRVLKAESMHALGGFCGIDVGAAVAGILKKDPR